MYSVIDNPIPPMKHATVFEKRPWANIIARSGYRATFDHADAYCDFIPFPLTDESVGRSVVKALSASQFHDPRISPPESLSSFGDYAKVIERYKRWTGFVKSRYPGLSSRMVFRGMKCCNVTFNVQDNVIVIEHTFQQKTDEWVHPQEGADVVSVSYNSAPEEIGAAVRLALSRCRAL